VFAAELSEQGYDLRTSETYASTMSAFDSIVGLSYLKALHCNDSKGAFQSHRDLHQNIGMGELGLLAFANLMADPRLDGLPFILETPMLDGTLNAEGDSGKVWTSEIALLYEVQRVVQASKPEQWPAALESDANVQELFQGIKAIVDANNELKEAKKAAKKAEKALAKAAGRAKPAGKKKANRKAASDSELSELSDQEA
jgi:AP endonuclease-1